jgi:predicted ATP-grasp superfamily ATP-dependent carboligase
MNKIIILGGSQTGLALARAFGCRGCTVYVVNCYDGSIAQFSKYVKKTYEIYFNHDEDASELLNFLLFNKDKFQDAFIIPDNDYSVLILAKMKKDIAHLCSCLVNDYETIAYCIDKKLTYKVADELDIPIPITFYPDDLKSIDSIEELVGFPCIIKPKKSFLFKEDYKQKVVQVRNLEELKRIYNVIRASNHEVIISEIIPGDDSSLFLYSFYIDREHRLIGEFMAQKIRQTPPLFGTGGVVRSREIIPEIRSMSLKLLERINYTGFGMIEYKLDVRDNTYKIIDFNARPILFYELFNKSKMHFTDMILTDIDNRNVKTPSDYITNTYWIDLFGDIYYYLFNIKNINLTLKEFISPYFKKHTYDSFSILDPSPFLHHFVLNLKTLLKSKEKYFW